jgi:hypothetical protein
MPPEACYERMRREIGMNVQGDFLLLVMLSMTAAAPAAGQTASAIPDFSGTWSNLALSALEQPLSGPGPVRNTVRLRNGRQAGVGDINRPVGDFANPILRPWAAEVVKKFGEITLAGKGYPTPRNQCWPEQVPFILGNYGVQILQQPDKVTFLYPYDHQFRQVRLNRSHPAHPAPSWYGDAVGHYEGDTLIVDTIGVRVGPYSMIDWYGTPFTEALHLVERYRPLDYDATKEAVKRAAREHRQADNPSNGPAVDLSYKGNGLQIELTIADDGAFTTPWSATVTLRRAVDEQMERVCADNTQWYPGVFSAAPTADKPDF